MTHYHVTGDLNPPHSDILSHFIALQQQLQDTHTHTHTHTVTHQCTVP